MNKEPFILCVIPSRLASTRLPEKPLAQLHGKTLVQRVWEAATQEPVFNAVVVATDHDRIVQAVEGFHGSVIKTPAALPTGTDRVAYVAKHHFPQADIVVNFQGDEPFMTPEALRALVAPFATQPTLQMATLACPLDWEKEYNSPDAVKVVTNKQGMAIAFSRSPIPYLRVIPKDKNTLPVYWHKGMYAFRSSFLHQFTQWEQTPLEGTESLEQLRAMENGVGIAVSVVPRLPGCEINTPEELAYARQVLEKMYDKQ